MGYRLSEDATFDMLNIFMASIDQFGAKQSEKYRVGLEQSFAFLGDYPLAARERREVDPPVRVHPYRSHLIFYDIEGDGIVIQRIRHSHEDWINHPMKEAE